MKKFKPYLLLNLMLLFNSLGGICSKIASGKQFFSFEFILLYGLMMLILVIYALLWQQIIKKIPLNTACANKAVDLLWGMVWGAVVFKEHISLANIIGVVIVLVGVLLMVIGGDKKNE